MSKRNPIGWVEIPVEDMDRAKTFYNKVFGFEYQMLEEGETKMAMFPFSPNAPASSGGLVEHTDFYKPSKEGVLIYFTAPEGDVNLGLKRVTEAGGSVVKERTSIGEHGFIAFFMDSEGNRIGFHSNQ